MQLTQLARKAGRLHLQVDTFHERFYFFST
jgi:hypothetical protein